MEKPMTGITKSNPKVNKQHLCVNWYNGYSSHLKIDELRKAKTSTGRKRYRVAKL